MFTVNEIKEILRRGHISISKRRGQNFLVEQWVQKKIIAALDIKPSDEIVEIGPGLGALTEDLAEASARVWAVEKDKALVRLLRQKLSGYPRLEIIEGDILQTDLTQFSNQKLKVVGNLPYYISTAIIAYLLEEQRKKTKDIFITVQYEVGKRLIAEKGSKEYSALSLLVQYFTEASLLFSLPKKAFYPQPKVDSVFVYLNVLSEPRVKVNNQEQFFQLVHSCFQQRRKMILNSLIHKLGKTEKDKVSQGLKAAGIDTQSRPEELSLAEFAQIENIFYQRRIKFE